MNTLEKIKVNLNLIDQIQKEFLFIHKSQPTELVIHKLLFFSYGIFSTQRNYPLFEDVNFEAWAFGPIEVTYQNFMKQNKPNEDKRMKLELTTNDYKFVIDILIGLISNYSTGELIEMSHYIEPGLEKNSTSRNNQIISQIDMEEYFKTRFPFY